MNFSWLCVAAFIALMIPVIYFGITSRLKYAKQILDAQAKGAFSDLNTPKVKSRFRRLAVVALIGLSGMTLFLLGFVILQVNRMIAYSGVVITIAILFGISGAAAGLLMQREINRRL
jgi:hypothetical protein